jgi:hypothetical protein
MSCTTSSGWDTIATWLDGISTVAAPMRAANWRSASGAIASSWAATKQLASRARRRIHGAGTDPASDLARQREVVGAFLAASRDGDFEALLALLDPDVVLRADAATVQTGAESEVRGADAVARTFAGRARAARLALVDGAVGLVWSQGGQPRVIFGFTVTGGRITGIELLGDPGPAEPRAALNHGPL